MLCHLLSVVVVSSSSAVTYPFPKSVWVCATCRWLAESCHPLSQLVAETFGISPQDGYSRGSSRTSFSQPVSPCVLPPQSRPSGWSNLSFCPYPPSSTETPQAWGVRACLGTRTEREREGCVAETPPPAPAEHWCIWESKSDAACFYITDLMGFVVLAYILMLQLSLAVSETSRPPPVLLLCIFFLKKKESHFPFFPRFSSLGLNEVSFILEQEGVLVVCGMNERGLFLPLAQLNRESVSQIILFQFWKKCVCVTPSTRMSACTHTLGTGQISTKGLWLSV